MKSIHVEAMECFQSLVLGQIAGISQVDIGAMTIWLQIWNKYILQVETNIIPHICHKHPKRHMWNFLLPGVIFFSKLYAKNTFFVYKSCVSNSECILLHNVWFFVAKSVCCKLWALGANFILQKSCVNEMWQIYL